MDNEPKYSRCHVFYCKHCYKDILKCLETSVEMPVKINNTCNTYDTNHVFWDATIVTAKMSKSKWKLTNDSRRRLIKDINVKYMQKVRIIKGFIATAVNMKNDVKND